jgi:hypothetical protein
MISAETIDGVTYYSITRRGVEYLAYCSLSGWGVSTRRLALGRRHVGGFKYYDSVEQLADTVKAFRGLDLLLAAPGVPS